MADSAIGAAQTRTDGSGSAREEILSRPELFWRKERADRFGVIVDAADYFAAARRSMMSARRSILLVGWDFDLRINLVPDGASDGMPADLGGFLKALVRRSPDLRISILKWDMAVLYTIGSQMLPRLALDLYAVRRIRMRFDSHHPRASAHHQKIVVIDDRVAYCGGIDMTTDRWDTRMHLPNDPRRRRPAGGISGPWHDATAVLDGQAAKALGDLCRERWRKATGQRLRPAAGTPGPEDPWPDCVKPRMRDVDVAIARTMPASRTRPPKREIEALWCAAIAAARRTIYIESQYFASASICEAIAGRLAEPDGPEVVVVNPLSAMGWLEERAMNTARHLSLSRVRRADRYDRFGIFHPVNAAGDPIYVHAKVLIVDNRLIRVGSSNVNNRSMGADTECDLAVEATSTDQARAIETMRDELLAEHLDCDLSAVRNEHERTGTLLGTVNALRRPRGRTLHPLPEHCPSDLGLALSRSGIADPERPRRPETMMGHAIKRMALRHPTSLWAAVAVGAIALAGGGWAKRRSRRISRAGGP